MICKCSIIVINDNSLWGKYNLRNADFRFGTPSRPTFSYIRQQITRKILGISHLFSMLQTWDIPTFRSSDFWDIPTFFELQSWDIPTFPAYRFAYRWEQFLGYPKNFVPIVLQIDVPNKNSSGLRYFSNRSCGLIGGFCSL